MKNLKIAFSLVLLSGLFSFGLMAQGNGNSGNHEINVEFTEITLLEVVSPNASQNIELSGSWGSLNAGEEIDLSTELATNDENRLHYKVFSPQGGGKKFTVSVESGTLPGQGWTIQVTPDAGDFPNSNSQGNAAGTVDLRSANSGVNFVTNIHKIAWTGTNANTDGWGLNYVLKVTDINNFESGDLSNPITVTYTIDEV